MNMERIMWKQMTRRVLITILNIMIGINAFAFAVECCNLRHEG